MALLEVGVTDISTAAMTSPTWGTKVRQIVEYVEYYSG
jgi:hypothetical protein